MKRHSSMISVEKFQIFMTEFTQVIHDHLITFSPNETCNESILYYFSDDWKRVSYEGDVLILSRDTNRAVISGVSRIYSGIDKETELERIKVEFNGALNIIKPEPTIDVFNSIADLIRDAIERAAEQQLSLNGSGSRIIYNALRGGIQGGVGGAGYGAAQGTKIRSTNVPLPEDQE